MDFLDKVRVRNILEHALEYPWRYQDIGLLALRLDEHREYALHVWAPDRCLGTPPIHDHPFDFVSRIIVGELKNARYWRARLARSTCANGTHLPTRNPEARTTSSSHPRLRPSGRAMNTPRWQTSCTTVTNSQGP